MRSQQEQVQMIRELSDAYGVSGFEDDVVQTARRWIDPEEYIMTEDHMRNLIIRSRKKNGGVKILLDAHSDEVGFMVQAVKPNGTMTFLPLGGWAANNVSAHKVKVRDHDGHYISGIVAAKPVHFMSESERNSAAQISSMVIDVGSMSRQQTEQDYRIDIGAPVVPDVLCEWDEKHQMLLGKAMDCRIGAAAMVQTMEQIKSMDIRNDVTATLTSQEEVGDRGIRTAMNQVEADVALVFEGCPADDTFTEGWLSQTVLGKGPMLRHMDRSIIANPRWMRYVLDLASEKNIPVQTAVRSGGGNNGAVVQLMDRGIPTIVVGVPVRYIHSHHGFAYYPDYRAAVDLAVSVIENLTKQDVESF